jgi:hypothetical protein
LGVGSVLSSKPGWLRVYVILRNDFWYVSLLPLRNLNCTKQHRDCWLILSKRWLQAAKRDIPTTPFPENHYYFVDKATIYGFPLKSSFKFCFLRVQAIFLQVHSWLNHGPFINAILKSTHFLVEPILFSPVKY